MARTKNTATKLTACERKVYQRLHIAWRAGIIDNFYFGRRDMTDTTVVWRLNDTEYARDARKTVAAQVETLIELAGIISLELGPPWCGYRGLDIEYADGTVSLTRWNGRRVVTETNRVAVAA